ncbi:glycosyltransferase [Acidobacteriota bacterium]
MPLAKALSFLSAKKIIFDPLASRFETKIIDWQRSPENSWQAKWNFHIDRWAFKLSDIVLADTQAHKDYYCREFSLPPEKVAVLPVGFDDDLFNPHLLPTTAEKRTPFKVLFFGSFLPLHGVEVIIKASQIISEKDSTVQFRLIGSGQTLERSQALALKFGLNNVLFENWLPLPELPGRIFSADICLGIFGKTEKAQRVVPHKIFQAMGMMKPVVTYRTPAVREFFTHRENIFLTSEASAEHLARAILELKENNNMRQRIAEKGYLHVSRNFSPLAIGSALIKIIERNFGCISGSEIL